MYKSKLDALLPRCFEMYEYMSEHIDLLRELEPVPEIKHRLAFQSGILSFEHGLSALKLIQDGFLSSGFALMRPQYESLIRGFWLMFADNTTWLAKLSSAGQVKADEFKKLETPMLGDMLKALDKTEAPAHILTQLHEFRTINNTPLNSFTHSGLLALIGNGNGYEPKMMYDAIRNCNAVAAINMQMLSNLTGYDEAMEPISDLHHQFVDCLPIHHA
ncbi:DUF6988 family protein [Alishewanella sp. HL-SH05]|uniref:DUF6988 family protein n=1 Tax=Alishewanella sp. HL-SH05 TaxID=3461145 RepID=UPI004042033A